MTHGIRCGVLSSLAVASILVAGCPSRPIAPQAPASALPPQPQKPAAAPATVEPEWGCVYATAGKLLWLPAGGSGEVTLSTSPGETGWFAVEVSPDDQKLAFEDADGSLKITDLATGKTTQLAPPADEMEGGDFAWSPDGKTIARVGKGDIHLGDAEGFSRQLTTRGGVGSLGWSPDGKKIAYGRRANDDKDLGLWAVDAAGGEPVRLVKGTGDVFGASAPSWSPDGKTIAFTHAWEGGALCFVRADGSGARLDIGPAWGKLRWLDDNSAVIYDAAGSEVETDGIYKCSPGGQPETVVKGPYDSFDVTSDGRTLVATGYVASPGRNGDSGPGMIRIRVLNAGKNSAPPPERSYEGASAQVAWRPDGAAAAFLIAAETAENVGTVYTWDLAGEPQILAQDATHLYGWASKPGTPTEATP